MRQAGWWRLVLAGSWVVLSLAARAADPLRVVQASPQGEAAKLEEVNEIRVLFSEPMVELGRIPDPVKAPFFTVAPGIQGSFRWSGTRLLIFTPAHDVKLPYATTYTVKVDASAACVSGQRLEKPYTFTFTTPTVRLLRAQWYRKGGRFDAPAVFALRFNQPVSPQDVAAHLSLHFTRHEWKPPEVQKEVMGRMARENPQAFKDFQSKVANTILAVNSSAPVAFKVAQGWDTQRVKPGDDLVVLESTSVPPPQAQITAELDEKLPGVQGRATPGTKQTYEFFMEPAFFVDGLTCSAQCSTEFFNAIVFRGSVVPKDVIPRLRVVDVTEPGKETALKPGKAKAVEEGEDIGEGDVEEGDDFGASTSARVYFDALGLDMQPARTYALVVDRNLKAADGQVLGYDWYGQVDYWHKSAFTSFGTGHGVWEASGGPQLPFYARNLVRAKQWLAPVKPEDLVPTVMKLDGWTLGEGGTPARCKAQAVPPFRPRSARSPPSPMSSAPTGSTSPRP